MNYLILLLLQFDWNKLRPENLFGQQILERTPAGLSLIYMGGIALLLLLLLLSFIRNLRPKFAFEEGLPKEVRRKLSLTMTNRSLRIWQFIFVFLAFFVYGFHVYWAAFAEKDNEHFQALSSRDLRVRRTSSTALRGWMLDRSGKLVNSLAFYKKDKDGNIDRTYALDREMAHLYGTEIGTPGLERTLYKQKVDPMPESWEVLTRIKKPEDEQRDVRITIDRDLQTFVAQQLQGKKGAIVVINPQSGDVLAIYSNPSFALSEVKNIEDMHKLERDKMNKPLLSRATREYYVPGSTFKTFTMISAFRAGKQNSVFPSYDQGYIPFRGSRPIVDATQKLTPPSTVTGSCDGGCGEKDIKFAYQVSSNQFFAQLAVSLERDRIGETARAVGIASVDTPEEAGTQGYFSDIWNTSNKRIAMALAPARSTIVTGKKITLFDIGLEGMGQGYAGQITPFQMALIASIPANLNGNLMMPKIEADLEPKSFGQVISPQQAAQIREIMATVTEEPGGTAERVFRRMDGTGIRVGGKTGTAEKMAPVYDKDGKQKTIKKKRKVKGLLVEYDAPLMTKRTDSWFISIAPLESPQLAIAVVVEAGGFGATTAAPIAVNIIMKARELGLLGDQYKPKTPAQTPKPKKNG